MNLKVEDTFDIGLDPESNFVRAGKIQKFGSKANSEVVGRSCRVVYNRFCRKFAASLGSIVDRTHARFVRRDIRGDGILALKVRDCLFVLGLLCLSFWEVTDGEQNDRAHACHFFRMVLTR